MSKNLFITEKPSQIAALKLALQDNGLYDDDVVIYSLAGHIMRLKLFKEYDVYYAHHWNKLVEENAIPFFPNNFEKVVSENPKHSKYKTDYKKMFKEVSALIKKCETITLSPDPDVEGMTLAMEVIAACNAENKVIGAINMNKLDRTSMKKEVNVINKIPYALMFDAGEARAIFDQMFGFNLSILATEYLYGGNVLEIGGVSLPTIRMIVERDVQFEAHTVVPYWKISAKAKHNGKEFKVKLTVDDKKQLKTKAEADEVKIKLEMNKNFTVTDFEDTKIKNEKPPLPYDLTGLQADAIKKFKYSINQVDDAAQHNYDIKIEGYPRTDANYYSDGEFLDSPRILKALSGTSIGFRNMLKFIQTPLVKRTTVFNDKKLTDEPHTALSPLEDVTKEAYEKLDEVQKNVFDLITKRYIIQFAKDFSYLDVAGKASHSSDKNIKVQFSEKIATEIGFKQITEDEVTKDRTIPNMSIGETIEIIPDSIVIEKGETAPKPRFTEASLLLAMKSVHLFFDDPEVKKTLKGKGIGTPATRKDHVNKIIRQGYATKKSGKLVSSAKARFLIKSLSPKISSPVLRANLENGIQDIIAGKISKEKYLNEIKNIVSKICVAIKTAGKFEKREVKTAEKTAHICPVSGCGGAILKSEKVFRCENAKFKNGKSSGCKFTMFRNQEKFIKRFLDEDDLILLLSKKDVEGSNKNKLRFCDSSKGFTVRINPDGTLVSGDSSFTPVAHPNGITEHGTYFMQKEKKIWKTYMGKSLTIDEVENLFKGEKIIIDFISKEKKPYKKNVWYAKNKKQLESTFAKSKSNYL